MTLPTMSVAERQDLESEAGYTFLSNEQAQRYRLRSVQRAAIDRMLANADSFAGKYGPVTQRIVERDE